MFMKKLILLIGLLAGISASAQTTNIVFRVTVENSVTGTNNSTLTLAAGTPKDLYAIQGLIQAYNASKVSLGTNAQATLETFVKQDLKDVYTKPYSQAAQAKEKESLVVNKLPDIIMTRWDDLTTAQKNQLIAIAAAFP